MHLTVHSFAYCYTPLLIGRNLKHESNVYNGLCILYVGGFLMIDP